MAGGRTESNSHTNASAVGANTLILNCTDQRCDMTPFTESYEPIKDVPVVTAATACNNLDTGLTIVCILHQALCFPSMAVTPLSPNQVCSNGENSCDDQHDPHRWLRIHDPKTGLDIHFTVEGSMVGFATRRPTFQEVETCPNLVVLTSDEPWDPHSLNLPHNWLSEED